MPGMTLLVTFYSSSGIVFAADSAITSDRGRGAARVRKEEKVLRARKVGVNGGWVGYFPGFRRSEAHEGPKKGL